MSVAALRTFARRCIALGPRSGGVFALRSFQRITRGRHGDVAQPLIGCRNVVFVCHGNILRSPFAAALFTRLTRHASPTIAVSSAGLRALTGRSADPRGLDAAIAYDIDLSAHRSRPLTRHIVRDADAVVVMDFANEADFLARFPEFRHKLRLLGAFDPGAPRPSVEIVDPYTLGVDGVAKSYVEVARCIGGLVAPLGLATAMPVEAAPGVRSPYVRPSPGPDRTAVADAGRPSGQ
jgi:protein-tyrosine phosphatase